jgi:hypothetical protein
MNEWDHKLLETAKLTGDRKAYAFSAIVLHCCSVPSVSPWVKYAARAPTWAAELRGVEPRQPAGA